MASVVPKSYVFTIRLGQHESGPPHTLPWLVQTGALLQKCYVLQIGSAASGVCAFRKCSKSLRFWNLWGCSVIIRALEVFDLAHALAMALCRGFFGPVVDEIRIAGCLSAVTGCHIWRHQRLQAVCSSQTFGWRFVLSCGGSPGVHFGASTILFC